MSHDIITVRFVAGTHQTNTIRGKRASSTSSYLQAAIALANKLYPSGAAELKRLEDRCDHGFEVYEAFEVAAKSEVIWIGENVEKPDSELAVLVELVGDNEPVWLGFWDGTTWRDACTGGEFAGQVVAWADLPKGRRGS